MFTNCTVCYVVLCVGDLKYIWLDITKMIDSLHIKNHRDPQCKRKYDPSVLKEEHPGYNTMSCEQTFAWMSRYKKILAMCYAKDPFSFLFAPSSKEEELVSRILLCTQSQAFISKSKISRPQVAQYVSHALYISLYNRLSYNNHS